MVYNKPNGCSATGALAPGADHQQQQEEEEEEERGLKHTTPYQISGDSVLL
jgi:hypothetical protein